MSDMNLKFELENDLFWKTETVLPFWRGFQSRRGPYGAQDSESPSDGTVEIVFAPEGCDTSALKIDEVALVEWFLENVPQISEALLFSVFEAYPTLQKKYGYSDQELDAFMPDIEHTSDLQNYIGLHLVFIHPITKNGIPYIGFEFGCTWDPEHGLGVLMHGTRTIDIGGADTAFLLWIAEKDARTP